MATVNTRANAEARVRAATPRLSAEEVARSTSVELPSRERTDTSINEVRMPARQEAGGNLEQMVATDFSRASQPQVQAQAEPVMQAQSEQVAPRQRVQQQTRVAEQAGMAQPVTAMPRGHEIASRIPVIQVPDQLGIETTRAPRYDAETREYIHDSLAQSGLEASDAQDRYSGWESPSVPSPENLDTLDQARRREDTAGKVQQSVIRATDAEVAMREAAAPTQRVTGQPDSVFNRPSGWNGKSRAPRLREPSVKRPASVMKRMKNAAKAMFSTYGRGYKIYTKALGLSVGLGLRDVGIGMREFVAVLEENPEMLERLFEANGQTLDTSLSPSELADIVNANDMYVATFKPPNNRGQDFQRRRLRVLKIHQRGIFLHPIMAAMYTADFDGDDMQVTLDPNIARYAKDPMDHMVGIDGKMSLNVDFLPVSRIVDGYAEGKGRRDFVREVMLGWLSRQSASASLVNPYVDAILELSDTYNDPDAQEDAWAKLFVEARRLSDGLALNGDDALMSRLIRSVYSGMQRLRAENMYDVADQHKPDHIVTTPKSADDRQLYEVLDGMTEGVIPHNFQEFKVLMNGFLGNVEGKNAPFRFTADVGKMMKMDSRLRIGDEYVVDPENGEQMKSFFETTMKYAESNAMAKEVKKQGRSDAHTQIMRMRVIAEVGFYGDLKEDGSPRYANYGEFLQAFVDSYHENSATINEANLVMLTNMGIASDSNRSIVSPINFSGTETYELTDANGNVILGEDGKPKMGRRAVPTLSDIAEPMRSIYGKYSVERMFRLLVQSKVMRPHVDELWLGNPNKIEVQKKDMYHTVEREYEKTDKRYWITNKYASWSIDKFVHENRLLGEDSGMSGIRTRRVLDLANVSDVDSQFQMLLCLADKRTGTASKFNSLNYGKIDTDSSRDIDYSGTTVEMMDNLIQELDRLDKMGDRKDQMLWINDIVETLTLSGSDMFTYFGMDNAAGFLQSKWTQKMLEHKGDMEVLGGIRTAMAYDYRMERVTALSNLPDPDVDMDRFMDAYNNLELARDELAAASEVWHGIISEIMAEQTPGQKSVFQTMRENADKPVSQRLTKYDGYRWLKDYDAKDYWGHIDEMSHTGIRDVIMDLDLDRKTKWAVIADVVRYWENDAYLKSWEVGFQLEIGNDSTYSLTTGAKQAGIGSHRDFEQAFNRWGKMTQDKLQEEIDKASEKYRNRQGALTSTLQRLDSSPWEHVLVSDETYADALLAVKDKSYSQTEKGQQHPWTNAIYAALSYQRNGGYAHDIYRTDDRVLGLRSIESLGIRDIVHLLANPNEDMWVYNEYGEVGLITGESMVSAYLGRDLGGSLTESDMWDFLEANPRVAAALRGHCACVKTNSDGDGYLGSVKSIEETIGDALDSKANGIDHVKYLMRDHPIYAAIISMCSRSLRVRTRNETTGEVLEQRVGSVSRNERRRLMEIEDYIAKRLYSLAGSDMESYQAATALLEDLGVTEKALADVLTSDYDKFLDSLGLPAIEDGNALNDALWIYCTAANSIGQYIEEIRKNVDLSKSLSTQTSPSERITSFHDENDDPIFLSNMYEVPVTYNGITYRNSEAAFQAQKCANERDRLRFVNLEGTQARHLGRQVKLRSDWESIKIDVMREVVHAKFSDPEMRRLLKATGNAELVEGNTWNETFWGVFHGRGQNYLGRILMEERSRLFPNLGTEEIPKPRLLGLDISSVASFWDVVQELSGAKTNVSTGIEGSETYHYGEWASHMSANDHYANLEAVFDDVDQSWDGALLPNVLDAEGLPVRLSVAEDGTMSITRTEEGGETITYTGDEITSKNLGVDEIVVRAPDAYTVPDRSTDSHGTQVNSLFAYMVSKRSNGAEAFNLKAKKAGIDGLDSITKMNGMHLMDVDEATGEERRRDYFDIKYEMQWIIDHYGEAGQDLARMQLAERLLEENKRLGYKDLTLSNYMSIAELMLNVSDDGQVQLRSLEMLYTAIKHRIGTSVDELEEEQLHERTDEIVHDTSDNGVGFVGPGAGMLTVDGFSKFRPNSKASSVNGIRMNSSVFERNFDLLDKIRKNAKEMGIGPMRPKRAQQLNESATGLYGVKDLIERTNGNIVRGYNLVGAFGAYNMDKKRNVNTAEWTIGPSNAIVIGDLDVNASEVEAVCDRAYQLGMTIIVSRNHLDKVPRAYRLDMMPCSDQGDAIIPCFDMRLNGAESGPYNGGIAIGQVPPSRYVVSVEDSVNEFELGDAEAVPTRAFRGRIKQVENGSRKIESGSLFPNVYARYGNSDIEVDLASDKEVQQKIANGVRCTIDYGIVQGGHGFEQRKRDVDNAIERYRNRLSQANADGIMMGDMLDCKPGDIVAWARASITDNLTGEKSYVLAPIIPFQLHGPKKNVPERFSVQKVVSVDDDHTLFAVDWTNTSDPSFAKYFDSSGGANKGMISFESTIEEDRLLVDGTPIDVYIAKPSTNSRKVGTDRRIKTMISLMTKARLDGYNFARDYDGAFPDNDDLRETLVRDRVSQQQWVSMLTQGTVRFCEDQQLDAFLNHECLKILRDGGNPSDYLANVFTDENGNERVTNVMWEFEAMFDRGINYENQLLRFLHSMMPNFCPNGIEDMGEDYLFRMYRDEDGSAMGYDMGVVQMRASHKRVNGNTSWVWDNVYIGMSFFGEDYSGFSRPNIDGASNFMDAMNTAAYYHNKLDDRSSRARAIWATSDLGRRPHDGGAIGTPDPSDMIGVEEEILGEE